MLLQTPVLLEIQRNAEKERERKRKKEKYREMQRNAEKCKEMQRNTDNVNVNVIHANILPGSVL